MSSPTGSLTSISKQAMETMCWRRCAISLSEFNAVAMEILSATQEMVESMFVSALNTTGRVVPLIASIVIYSTDAKSFSKNFETVYGFPDILRSWGRCKRCLQSIPWSRSNGSPPRLRLTRFFCLDIQEGIMAVWWSGTVLETNDSINGAPSKRIWVCGNHGQ